MVPIYVCLDFGSGEFSFWGVERLLENKQMREMREGFAEKYGR